ncbi:MAG: 50S ribosomal protein L28 [Candidatus Omnitrophica bacterium]|nr:50S ribosomal protein L28 [Candidatus Omnitrophota bacterium]MDD5042090.1 50S ribosomal protein L28 [Candidatus Omnitrophota bacterium]MDD5500282.1 50S ribosomal protein L28 [Candidatus Omnitrophota bacterium]
MLKKCAICGKGSLNGKVLSRKGQHKAKGGTGSKIARWSKRKFLPNLQKMRILLNGRVSQVYVCAKCIKKGELKKA